MEKSYYEKYFHFEDDNWWFVGRREILADVTAQYVNGSREPALDAGCGTGGLLNHLRPAGQVIGLDFEWLALNYARRRGNRKLLQGSALELPFRDESFGTVYSLDVLEHLDDDRGGLSEIKRVCRPGGKIIITVPAYQFLWSQHDIVNQHRRRYVERELRDLVQSAGLQIELLSYNNTLLFPAVAGVRLAKKAWARLRKAKVYPGADNEEVAEPWNTLLARIYSFERHLLGRVHLPFGVSLICIATKP